MTTNIPALLLFAISVAIGIIRILGNTNRFFIDVAHFWVAGLAGATIMAYLAIRNASNTDVPQQMLDILKYRTMTHYLFWYLSVLELACFLLHVGHH